MNPTSSFKQLIESTLVQKEEKNLTEGTINESIDNAGDFFAQKAQFHRDAAKFYREGGKEAQAKFQEELANDAENTYR